MAKKATWLTCQFNDTVKDAAIQASNIILLGP